MRTFDPTRSAALRQQLSSLPTTAPEGSTTARNKRGPSAQQQEYVVPLNALPAAAPPKNARAKNSRWRSRWVIGGVGVAVTAGLLASGPFQPTSTTGADFIPAMARPQQPEDLLPQDLREKSESLDVGTSRLVGTERGRSYYAVESFDAMMCLVVVEPVPPPGAEPLPSRWLEGCTLLTNFDSYPLQIDSATANSRVWLVSANIEPTDRQITEQTQLSPNLYIEYTDGVLPQPGDEGYEYEPSWP